jgi:hypothetical protein
MALNRFILLTQNEANSGEKYIRFKEQLSNRIYSPYLGLYYKPFEKIKKQFLSKIKLVRVKQKNNE